MKCLMLIKVKCRMMMLIRVRLIIDVGVYSWWGGIFLLIKMVVMCNMKGIDIGMLVIDKFIIIILVVFCKFENL